MRAISGSRVVPIPTVTISVVSNRATRNVLVGPTHPRHAKERRRTISRNNMHDRSTAAPQHALFGRASPCLAGINPVRNHSCDDILSILLLCRLLVGFRAYCTSSHDVTGDGGLRSVSGCCQTFEGSGVAVLQVWI